MISLEKEALRIPLVSELMIPSEKVAHVQIGNPLEHALLVLVKSGYSAVPVLDPTYQFQGVISKTKILEETLGIEEFELNRLSEMTVKEVMDNEVPCLQPGDNMIDAMHKLIDFPFVCVTNEEGEFDGIVTRRTILKQFSKHYHETFKYNDKSK
ncbi:cyclic-di-AMP-binding protein CbpB [Halobacillus karajensis]|uniref:CBS domain-containing protein YkuL n=1 Tax=Halobacillus karajensis TaxID=195088 RepID=A0A024P451_9BACI|nr:cyclic-di-AMP-binding protein CbpB [Halobacillus karajensis]CDQ19927.1 CBS domain-containing protein YkuL [Halobacillus karajensis]CDQ22387.1 CBS domain-containing protein YkuL [Halobacillus karajensis]CDQ28230.1 CBS domain-containing protein YkuL [Halobacillus karajensis]